jgi:hypothetical protein
MEPTYVYAIGPSLETIVHETGTTPLGARFAVLRIQDSRGVVTFHAAEVRPSGKLSVWPPSKTLKAAREHAQSLLADVSMVERPKRR